MLYYAQADEAAKRQYWEDFYNLRQASKLSAPSQFAAFVLHEAPEAGLIIEIGCGTGRDSVFFARQGFKVIAIDGSESAIRHCQNLDSSASLRGVSFHCASIGTTAFKKVLREALSSERTFQTMVYARFFLHAITEAEEDALLDELARTLKPGDIVAFEFRTVRDAPGTKVTTAHYRRFVQPPTLFGKAACRGFLVTYAVEGYGFAKYGDDDAYVARCLLQRGNC